MLRLVASSFALILFLTPLAQAQQSPQLIQFREIDFVASTLEVFNFGTMDVDLTGWRFCSHDTDQERQYTSETGLNGVTIESGTGLWIHFNNDAPAGNPNRINRSDLGAFALPLDQDAFGIQLFFPNAGGIVMFGNSALIADALQWNVAGEPVGSASFRTGQAVSVGLWTAVPDFISTEAGSVAIELQDNSGGQLHGPSDYSVIAPPDFPSFFEDFEALGLGSPVSDLGWPIVNTSANPADFTVTGSDPVTSPPGPPSSRAVRVVDVDASDVQNRFYSPAVNSPSPTSYTWRFFVSLETEPPSGSAAKPRYVVQHDNAGFENAWGIEFAADGLDLFVTATGGTPASVDLGGPLPLDQWTELRIRADFATQTVTGWVGSGPPISLPISLTGSAEVFRLCYRGEGTGNVMTSLLDNVSVDALLSEDFVRGDCNGDSSINVADAIRSIELLFQSPAPGACEDACDANDDGLYNIADPVFLLANLFTNGRPPAAPTACGPDPTVDSLGCSDFSPCN